MSSEEQAVENEQITIEHTTTIINHWAHRP